MNSVGMNSVDPDQTIQRSELFSILFAYFGGMGHFVQT